MNDVLAMCRHFLELRIAQGRTLIAAHAACDRMYVLRDGAFAVRRDGVVVVRPTEPGAFLGEISAVLGSVPTASIVAMRDSVVHVIDTASEEVRRNPELTTGTAPGWWPGLKTQVRPMRSIQPPSRRNGASWMWPQSTAVGA